MVITRDLIGRGERAPDFALPGVDRQNASRFYGVVGGTPAVVVFAGGDGTTARRLAGELRRRLRTAGQVHLVSGDPDESDEVAFLDLTGGVHEAYGIAADAPPTAVVLDRSVRVAAVEQPAAVDTVVAMIEELGAEVPDGRSDRHAPVLFVPDALDPAWCERLIDVWRAAAPVETGVETTADGRRVEALDRLRKRRRDHVVTDSDLLKELTSHVGRRVIPEVKKSFGFAATRFEGFKLGCYTADDKGFFDAHRDNLSEATAHRRFALSLNLNEGYEGGELNFPEYGVQRYRPDPGEALIFSGAHLHQVHPVTAGRRFVLLSFLF
ncbi:MAG: putative 2-oxoglutarate/Fe(II)-dependent dioxygenase YbiX [Myxococcota bacterium]|jgi:predicted 2-oxoglutarate/Fe(II)-dependent dioxygenase YbiX